MWCNFRKICTNIILKHGWFSLLLLKGLAMNSISPFGQNGRYSIYVQNEDFSKCICTLPLQIGSFLHPKGRKSALLWAEISRSIQEISNKFLRTTFCLSQWLQFYHFQSKICLPNKNKNMPYWEQREVFFYHCQKKNLLFKTFLPAILSALFSEENQYQNVQ